MIASEDGEDGEDEQSREEWSQVVNDGDEGRWSQIIDMVANHWQGLDQGICKTQRWQLDLGRIVTI